ncbi:MAG: PepSY domain-containing protein [Methylococcaceae bacterium]|nr:PepSY domain-containing protein [Methylococcaceae bacterium]
MSAPTLQTDLPHKNKTLEKLKARRKRWLDVHLWLGLGFGFFLAIIGLTGSVLVFWHELDEAINQSLYEAEPSVNLKPKSFDEILAAAKQNAPKGWNSVWLDAPQENGNYVFGFYYPEASPKPEEAESLNIVVNPYTAEVTGRRVFYHSWHPLKHSFVGFLFKLHYALFLGETGGTIVGILAVFFFVSVMTGLILWWPLTGNWKRVLTIKRRASTERFNHDLHQSAGFYSLIVMMCLLMSGLYFNLPDQFRWLVERFSTLTPEVEAKVSVELHKQDFPIQNALSRAQALYKDATAHFYTFGNSENATVTACYKDIPSLRSKVLDMGCVVIDPISGDILQIKDSAHGSGGDVFMQWQWPLHSGAAFGWTGRILVFITGLLCPLIFVTGVIRWLQKRRAKSFKKNIVQSIE